MINVEDRVGYVTDAGACYIVEVSVYVGHHGRRISDMSQIIQNYHQICNVQIWEIPWMCGGPGGAATSC